MRQPTPPPFASTRIGRRGVLGTGLAASVTATTALVAGPASALSTATSSDPATRQVVLVGANPGFQLFDGDRVTAYVGQQDDGTDIADLIGRGRREVLELLDRPRTTRDLSRLDGRAESTISYHLGVLARAGLVSKQRSGGSVGYRRTDLGDSLVTGGGRPGRRYDQSG